MNKKLFQLLIAAVTTLFSVGVLAQTAATNPNTDVPRVTTGGTVVMEDQVITLDNSTSGDVAGRRVVVKLPTGFVFSGTPTATATGATVALEDSSGDPTLNGFVTLSEGNTRASVTLDQTPTDGDTVTFKGSVTYSGGNATADLGVKNPTIFVETSTGSTTFLDSDNNLAQVVGASAGVSPIALQSTSASITVPNATADPVAPAHSVQYIVTVAAGKGTSTSNDTITFTYGTGVRGDTGTTITALALTDGAPAATQSAASSDGATSISLTLGGATTRSSQYLVTIAGTGIETTAQASPTTVAVAVSGDAGVAGSATVAILASTGSTIKLATAATKTALTNGADTAQALPTFEITEIFATDFSDGETITIVAPTGMVFTAAGTTTSSDGGATIAANALNGSGSEMTITITTAGPGATAETLSTAGMMARSTTSAALGDLSITAGKSITGESPNAPFTTLAVATGNAVGTVTISGPTTAGKVGAGTAGNTGAINLSESTYGAIATNSTFPFIQITPPTGITITGVAVTAELNSLDLGAPTAAVPADGTWVVPVTTESAAKNATGLPHILTVTYSVGSTVASGTAVTFTLGGDTNVSGTATVANVVDTTSSTSTGVIPDKETSIDFVAAGTLQVKEEFAAALSNTVGTNFRIIAPAGITFASTQPAATAPATALAVDTTFSANDTLLVTMTGTAGTDTITVTPNVFIAGNAAAGFNTFTVADGNTNDTNGAGVTAGSADILYVGTVASPDAGPDITVAEGVSVVVTVADGLAPLTAASADDGVATETIDGSTLTITGVSAGATTITVTDGLRVTDVVAVTVVSTAPPAVTSAASDGSTTDATISGGISTDNGASYATDGTVSVGDAISIVAVINVDSADVGEELDLLVAVQDTVSGDILLIDDNGALVPVDPLAAFDTRTLAATETVDVLGGSFTLTSAESGISLNIFVGYLRANGVVIFNSDPIPLVVQ